MSGKYSFGRYRWNAFWYGRGVLETFQIDALLSSFLDGAIKYPFEHGVLPAGMDPYLIERRVNKLVSDKLVTQVGEGYRITTEGTLHYGSGGYTAIYKKERRSVFSFWVSIVAIILSLTSFIITIVKSFV